MRSQGFRQRRSPVVIEWQEDAGGSRTHFITALQAVAVPSGSSGPIYKTLETAVLFPAAGISSSAAGEGRAVIRKNDAGVVWL